MVVEVHGHEEGDAQLYRRPGEVDEIRAARDCLDQFAARVTGRGIVEQGELDAVDAEAKQLVDEAVREAREADHPPAAELLTDVYVSY